ncbi:MAG TPA: ABC transporter permease, partial [Solirubrobacteraceae bacterium]|nr:ABC transporter permease [Solirubrobacteraceae bacterium]
GGIDLSVGAVMAASQLLLVGLAHWGLSGWPAIAAVLAAGFVVGAGVNGLLIGVAKLNFFVVTLASMTFGYGIVDVATNGATTILTSPLLRALGNDLLAGVPVPTVVFVVLLLLMAVVLHRTTLGRAVFSVGGNTEAARLAGIPVSATVVVVYGISGLCAALGGVIEAGRFMAATPTTGDTIALTSVAAVLLGGTSLKGGTGGLTGTVAGVLVIGVLGNGVDLLGINAYWQGIVTGLVLVAAVALDRFQHMGSGRRRRVMGRLRNRSAPDPAPGR